MRWLLISCRIPIWQHRGQSLRRKACTRSFSWGEIPLPSSQAPCWSRLHLRQDRPLRQCQEGQQVPCGAAIRLIILSQNKQCQKSIFAVCCMKTATFFSRFFPCELLCVTNVQESESWFEDRCSNFVLLFSFHFPLSILARFREVYFFFLYSYFSPSLFDSFTLFLGLSSL